MKFKEFLTIILVVIAGIFFATNMKKHPSKVTIKGKITNPKGEKVSFSNQDTSYSTNSYANGAFSISFNLDSASYFNFGHGPEVTAMYINPGDKIYLTIDTEQFDESIEYVGSSSSSFLAKKYLLNEQTNFFGKLYYTGNAEQYKNFLDNYKASVITELNGIIDSTFINSEIETIENNLDYFIESQKKLDDYSDDYRNYLWETKAITKDYNFYAALDSLDGEEFNKMIKRYISDFEIYLKKIADIKYLKKAKEQIKKTTKYWSERKNSTDSMPKKGEAAIDFNYPDKSGKRFSLADFKSNLVYVDVWATWCGPCIAEIPYLKELEADYHDKNIVFLSISVDQDKEAWTKMVDEKDLLGVQLWADNRDISENYAIYGIPRFMLFDTVNNVISTNAPRPSSDEIRELLDANL